ncbi:MAG: hypothetical protein Q7J48_12640 [Nocardioides sp.]|nr:hypothetical protein [Nocardioides sp.]
MTTAMPSPCPWWRRSSAAITTARPWRQSTVTDDRTRLVGPEGGPGRLARRSRVPLGYLSDQAKTQETFPSIDGVRWSKAVATAAAESA